MERIICGAIAKQGANTPLSDETWEFVQAIRGEPIAGANKAESDARRQRELLEWLAGISPRHEQELACALERKEAATQPRASGRNGRLRSTSGSKTNGAT